MATAPTSDQCEPRTGDDTRSTTSCRHPPSGVRHHTYGLSVRYGDQSGRCGWFVAALVAMFGFIVWLVSTLLGLHNPLERRHPTRAALGGLWLVTLMSFALCTAPPQTGMEELADERWIMQWPA